MSTAPSVRRLLTGLLGTLGALLAALLVVASLQVQRSNRQADAENRRTESFLLADSMRQSSDDLTEMVRLHVATGNPDYREHYEAILAIRSGEAPRPRDYDTTFWDRVLTVGFDDVEYREPESLVEQMEAARFTDAEFDALNTSLRTSDALAQVELEVMDAVEPRIAEGVDASYAADVAPAFARLVDDRYLAEKGRIMASIAEFVDLVDARTLADLEEVRDQGRVLVALQLGIVVGIVVVGARAFVVARRRVLVPLEDLTASTGRIADGQYGERAAVRGVAELERVATAFNEMAASVGSDVARRQQAEAAAVEARQAAEEASRAKSSFLAAMSHEIRTPMIGVTGMLEVLAQSDLTPQQRQMVGTAQSSAAALLQIIGDTLDFSKIEAGRLEIVPAAFDLRTVVDAAVATFIHTASAKGLRLVASYDERLAPAHVGDSLRLRQILSNFVSNAVKFTDVGGIEVAARVAEDGAEVQTVELAVTDTGVGIDSTQQQLLFEEFSQATPSTAGRFGGTGLGLVICRRLAVLMGGSVSLESDVGRGTTLRLVVPLPVGDPADVVPEATFSSTRYATTRPRPTREEAEAERSLVLVAEDHSVNRAVLLHQLDAIGFLADAGEDGEVALELFKTGRYAMVLTDLHMPKLDGYGLAQAIRRHEADHGWDRTPIMALTANVMHGEPERCRAVGMDDFAAKPTTIPLLAAKLHEWLPHLEFDVLEEDGLASGPDGASTAAVDPAVLAELTGGDDALAAEVLRDYLASTAADLGSLRTADADERRRLAHRIKGASLTVGATRVADLAARLEEAAAAGRGDADALEAALRTAFAELAASP